MQSSCGVPRLSRLGTRSPSSYTSLPIVGIRSTTRHSPCISMRTAAASMLLPRAAPESEVTTSTASMASSGRRRANAGSPSAIVSTVTPFGHSRRQSVRSMSSDGLDKSKSRT
eukprot:3787209-Prymnesium_polylepis.2